VPANTSLTSHWQAGAWFGSQLGGTAWLLLAALAIASRSPGSAAVLLACGVSANLVGCLLWTARARLDPYRAFQVLTAAVVLAGMAATRWLELHGEFGLLDPRVTPRTMYLLLLALWIGLAAVFVSKRRAALAAASG
jgi:hypothetical protein